MNRENNKSATRQGCCLCCYDLNTIYYDVDVIDVVVFFLFFFLFSFFSQKGQRRRMDHRCLLCCHVSY